MNRIRHSSSTPTDVSNRSQRGSMWHRLAAMALALAFSAPIFASAPITIEDRVACRVAVEEVRWSYTLWPETNPEPKPPLSAVLPSEAIRAQVEDEMRMGAALESIYGQRIDTAQLQAELDRMAAKTRAPDQLNALYDALANDPNAVAECLAKPGLIRRKLRHAYAWDENHHAAIRSQAENALAGTMFGQAPKGAQVQEMTYLRQEGDDQTKAAPEPDNDALVTHLSPKEWDERVARYANVGSQSHVLESTARSNEPNPQLHKSGPLHETEDAFISETLVRFENDKMTVKAHVWLKRSFDSWWQSELQNWSPISPILESGLVLSKVTGHGLDMGSLAKTGTDDTWRTEVAAPSRRYGHTAVWIGSEMIIWGGYDGNGYPASGGRYSPATNNWEPLSPIGAPSSRHRHTAVWTGIEIIIWGGSNNSSLNTGSRYNPVTDTWFSTSQSNAPSARSLHTAVWTGVEMIIWGGDGISAPLGSRYDPVANSWVPMSPIDAPSARAYHQLVWTGTHAIVWGGVNNGIHQNSGGRYDPVEDSWQPTTLIDAPSARREHVAVWTGNEMIIWGGTTGTASFFNNGSRYNPVTDSWTAMTQVNVPAQRTTSAAVWTGSEMIIWGGFYYNGGDFYTRYGNGGRYNPESDTWVTTTVANAPYPRSDHTGVWTGSEMIVWGGYSGGYLDDGGRYNPVTDSWAGITPQGIPPSSRFRHTAVWTGNEMIVWGGGNANYLGTGGRYDPALDAWLALSSVDAPDPRYLHSAVWTGSEMIIWGGVASWPVPFNDGGRYNPLTDSWVEVSGQTAPIGRTNHTAVWSGTEMIVWGGAYGDDLNVGSRYNPDSGNWTAMSLIGAPTVRSGHKAIWTGTEMIVWGGRVSNTFLDSGGRYDPVADSWLPTAQFGAPDPRYYHVMVWTGSEIIVWGGLGANYLQDGAKYNPANDAWTVVANANAPSARAGHSAVWTGAEMIVWGGGSVNPNNFVNTGGRYNPQQDEWVSTTLENAPKSRFNHTAVWTGEEMIVWGGGDQSGSALGHFGAYSAAGGSNPLDDVIFEHDFELSDEP